MRKKISIAIVYNEPVTEATARRKYISENGVLQEGSKLSRTQTDIMVDLSEVGVLEEREDIARALNAMGYKTTIFNVDEDISRFVNFLKEEQPDLVFNICESVGNASIHEMHIAGIYELMGIPYTGSDAFTLGAALNKVMVKEILLCHGLPTPRFQLFRSPVRMTLDESMSYPLIVKPSREDASIGIEPGSIV